MAEAIVQRLLAERHLPVRVRSAGIRAGVALAREARVALRNRGINTVARKAVQLTEEMVTHADLTLCAAEEHHVIVAGAIPAAAARTFVWGDFVERALPLDHQGCLEELLAELGHTAPVPGCDLADPVGRGQAAYDETAAVIDRLGRRTVPVLEHVLAPGPRN